MSARKDLSDILRHAKDQGWRTERTRNGHWKMTNPAGAPYWTGSTPGSSRSLANLVADLKRLGYQEGERVLRDTRNPPQRERINCPRCPWWCWVGEDERLRLHTYDHVRKDVEMVNVVEPVPAANERVLDRGRKVFVELREWFIANPDRDIPLAELAELTGRSVLETGASMDRFIRAERLKGVVEEPRGVYRWVQTVEPTMADHVAKYEEAVEAAGTRRVVPSSSHGAWEGMEFLRDLAGGRKLMAGSDGELYVIDPPRKVEV